MGDGCGASCIHSEEGGLIFPCIILLSESPLHRNGNSCVGKMLPSPVFFSRSRYRQCDQSGAFKIREELMRAPKFDPPTSYAWPIPLFSVLKPLLASRASFSMKLYIVKGQVTVFKFRSSAWCSISFSDATENEARGTHSQPAREEPGKNTFPRVLQPWERKREMRQNRGN